MATKRVRRNIQDHEKESKRRHQEIQVNDSMRKTVALNNLMKVRVRKLRKDRLITPLDKQVREIHDQDKIIERIEEFYTELYDSEQSTIIHTDLKEVPGVTAWDAEADTQRQTTSRRKLGNVQRIQYSTLHRIRLS